MKRTPLHAGAAAALLLLSAIAAAPLAAQEHTPAAGGKPPRPAAASAVPAAAAPESAAPPAPRERVPRPRRNSTELTREEIQTVDRSNLYDAIRSLRPFWLRVRGEAAGEEVRVYVDGLPAGGPRALRDVGLDRVRSAEFLDPRAATTRWGTGNSAGAILVITGAR